MMLRKVRSLAPMFVLLTFSAVPVVVAMVFTTLLLLVTVPPSVAVKAAGEMPCSGSAHR